MTPTTSEALLLRIAAALEELLTLSKSKRAAAAPAANVATDAEMDGKYGDPESKFKPRDWTHDWRNGQKFSECEPELLDMLAPIYEGFYEKKKAASDPNARYDLERFRLARGWAARKRAGWKPTPTPHVKAEEVKW